MLLGNVFRSDVLLGSLSSQVKLWGVVVGGVALGNCQGNGAVVIEGGDEDGRFPGELLFEKHIG